MVSSLLDGRCTLASRHVTNDSCRTLLHEHTEQPLSSVSNAHTTSNEVVRLELRHNSNQKPFAKKLLTHQLARIRHSDTMRPNFELARIASETQWSNSQTSSWKANWSTTYGTTHKNSYLRNFLSFAVSIRNRYSGVLDTQRLQMSWMESTDRRKGTLLLA